MAATPTNDEVLSRHVAWESYKTAGQISDADYRVIKRLDKSTETAMTSVLEEGPHATFEALFNVLRLVNNEATVQYTLALLDELLAMNPSYRAALHFPPAAAAASTGAPPNAPRVLSRLLSRTDWFTQARAAKLLAAALKAAPDGGDAGIVTAFLEWLTGQLRQPSAGDDSILVATGALAGLLRGRPARSEFALSMPLLETALKAAARGTAASRSQTLYNIGLSLWQLSYDTVGMQQLEKGDFVAPLVGLLKQGNKEKVMRVALLTLSRLLASGHAAVQAALYDSGLPRIVRIRSAQSFADEDIPELLTKLEEALGSHEAEMSSLEQYRKEVVSGTLDWGPMHSSTRFWQENAAALEEKDFLIVRTLVRLAASSTEPRTLAVACNDLSQFATAHPHGRYVVNDLDGKAAAMALMAHADAEVQKHALLCVQSLMLGRDKLGFLQHPAAAARTAAAPSTAAA